MGLDGINRRFVPLLLIVSLLLPAFAHGDDTEPLRLPAPSEYGTADEYFAALARYNQAVSRLKIAEPNTADTAPPKTDSAQSYFNDQAARGKAAAETPAPPRRRCIRIAGLVWKWSKR